MNQKLLLIIFVIVILFTVDQPYINAQSSKQIKVLKDFSLLKAEEYKIKKAHADSIAEAKGWKIRINRFDGTEMELQYFENGLPVYYSTENLNAAKTISSFKTWQNEAGGYNLDGSGETLGLWDGGRVLASHQEFGGRVIQKDSPSSTSDHSTHVAGTMIAKGVEPNAHGMSSGAELNAYDWNNDESEMAAAAAAGLEVSNHSYGIPLGWESDYRGDGRWAWLGDVNVSTVEDYLFGFYSNKTRDWDLIAYNAPNYLICRSAGNERSETGPGSGGEHWVRNSSGVWILSTDTRLPDGGLLGYDCIQTDKIGKNILTVAAVGDIPGGYSNPSDVLMSSFSSWGPADDGRIKPDISANGVGLLSASSSGSQAYVTKSGTSMSAPNLSGSVGLLLQHWKNLHNGSSVRSATLKGLIIHTADEAGLTDGPDYRFGWGLMNTYHAANLITLDSYLGTNELIRELSLNEGQNIEIQIQSNGNEPLKTTICWTDPPGTALSPALNPSTPALVNDLDLRITGPGPGIVLPWVLDRNNPQEPAVHGDNFVDNVEQIIIDNPIAGMYSLSISHKNNLQDGHQDFSLIISGLALTAPSSVTELISPVDSSMSVPLSVEFVWNRTEGAQFYDLQAATDSLFTTMIFEDSSIEFIKKSVDNLPDLSTIYWRVRPGNNGGYGSWSDTFSFSTVVSIPDAPLLIYPSADDRGLPLTINFIWAADDKSEMFKFELSKSITFLSKIFEADSLTDTTITVGEIPDGLKLYWRVYAKNVSGTSTPSTSNFYSLLSPPDNLTTQVSGTAILLNWNDNSGNEKYYVIERKFVSASQFTAIDTIAKNSTSYIDSNLAGGEYVYRVFAYNNNVTSDFSNEASVTLVSVNESSVLIPKEFKLFQNYPNPFNPSTSIKYALPNAASVNLLIFNSLGELVSAPIRDHVFNAGLYEYYFNASSAVGGLSSGVYLYVIDAYVIDGTENYHAVGKMLLLK